MMPDKNTVTKTLVQHSCVLTKEKVSFLKGIAQDYSKVKNYVYRRYSGIHNVNRLTPVYTVLNEMRACGLRQQLDLPVVYYELAVADAVTDIKSNWSIVKNKIIDLINANENLTHDDRVYICTVFKMNGVFSAVLNGEDYEMPNNSKDLEINVKKCNNLIRRLVRKYISVPKTENMDSFKVSPNGYKYKDGGIYLVSRTPRQRVFLPLKDNRISDRQILITLKGQQAFLTVPVETRIKQHDDYTNTVYIYIGNRDMITLSNGNIYGADLESIVYTETVRLDLKNRERAALVRNYEKQAADGKNDKAANIERNNLGRKKYDSMKARRRAKTQDFINTEINRMLQTEKPSHIVVTKLVQKNRTKSYSRTANLKMSRSFSAYVRQRLAFKCQVNSITLTEINSKGTGSVCCVCGGQGKRRKDKFICEVCGNETTIALNSAKNIEKKFNQKND